MATYISGNGKSATSSATSAAVTKPTSTAAGDLLIGVCFAQSGTLDFSAPSGWTLAGGYAENNPSLAMEMAVFTKVATASEPTSYTFTGAANLAAEVLTYRDAGGLDGVPAFTSTVQTSDSSVTATNTSTSASVTAAAAGETLVLAYGSNNRRTWTAPTGTTARFATSTTTGLVSIAAFDAVQASAGATPTYTATQSAISYAVSVALLLAPAAAAPSLAWSIWTGTAETPATLAGVWNGSTTVPGTASRY